MSLSLHMLFVSDIAWTVLKIVYIGLIVCLQRHTKVLRYITAFLKNLKRILTHLYCIECNETNIRHSNVQKNISHKKW